MEAFLLTSKTALKFGTGYNKNRVQVEYTILILTAFPVKDFMRTSWQINLDVSVAVGRLVAVSVLPSLVMNVGTCYYSKKSNLTAYKKIRIVVGNETCDLDSAVSALIQGFTDYLDRIKNDETNSAVIPLMNITEREYRIKTEVVFFLKRHNIPSTLLIFRDHIDLKALKEDNGIELELVLVDHHHLSDKDVFLMDSVVEVIDHRPQDINWPWPGRRVHMESVGSCATLVAQNLLRKHPETIDQQLSSLLRGPILIDTCNLSKEADRATFADIEVIEALERLGQLDKDRSKAFNEIVEAKTDINELTVDDLLIRDLKVTAGVPIVGLPMLVKKFLELQDSLRAIRSFAESRNTTIVVLIGLQLDSQQVYRDIAVFSLFANPLKEKIIKALTLSAEPSLELTLIREIHGEDESCNLLIYKQGNLRVTRKQILPIIRDIVSARTCQC